MKQCAFTYMYRLVQFGCFTKQHFHPPNFTFSAAISLLRRSLLAQSSCQSIRQVRVKVDQTQFST